MRENNSFIHNVSFKCPTWESAIHLLNMVLQLVHDSQISKASLGWFLSSYGVETIGLVHGFSFFLLYFAQKVEGRLCIKLFTRVTWSSSPEIPNEGTQREPLTLTIIHVQSILDLTNCPSYLFYVFHNPSLS